MLLNEKIKKVVAFLLVKHSITHTIMITIYVLANYCTTTIIDWERR